MRSTLARSCSTAHRHGAGLTPSLDPSDAVRRLERRLLEVRRKAQLVGFTAGEQRARTGPSRRPTASPEQHATCRGLPRGRSGSRRRHRRPAPHSPCPSTDRVARTMVPSVTATNLPRSAMPRCSAGMPSGMRAASAPVTGSKRSTPSRTGSHTPPPAATRSPAGTSPGGTGLDATVPSGPIRLMRNSGSWGPITSLSCVSAHRAPSPSARSRISPCRSTRSRTRPPGSTRTTCEGGNV